MKKKKKISDPPSRPEPSDSITITFTRTELKELRCALGNTTSDGTWRDDWVQPEERPAFDAMMKKLRMP